MFCTKCGAPMEDGQRFCSNCGAMAADSAPVQVPPPAPTPEPAAEPGPAYEPYSQPPQPPKPGRDPARAITRPKKKGRWVLPTILAVLLLAGAACAVLFWGNVSAFASNLIDKTFSSTEEYYQHVEKNAVTRALTAAETEETRALDEGFFLEEKLMLSLNESAIGDELLDLIEDETGVDISWLKNIGLYLSLGKEDELLGGSLIAFLNDKDIIDADYLVDMDKGGAYFRVPLLSSQYAELPMDEMPAGVSAGAMGAAELAERRELVQILVERYSEIVIQDLTKVEKERGELSAGGVSKSCTVFEVKIDGKVMLKLGKDVLKKLKNDAEFEKLFQLALTTSGYSEDMAEQAFDYVLENIDETLTELENTEPSEIENNILMTVYVDNQGRIIGRTVKLREEKKVLGEAGYALVSKGTDFGLKLSFNYRNEWTSYYNDTANYDEYNVVLEGSGKGSLNGSIEGSFDLRVKYASSYGGSETKEDIKALKIGLDGEIAGKSFDCRLTLTPTKDLVNLALENTGSLPGALEDLIRNLSAELRFSGKEKNAAFSIALKNSKKEMLTLSGELYPVEDFSVSVPRDAQEIEAWSQSIDYNALYTILEKLTQAGVPAELLDNLM